MTPVRLVVLQRIPAALMAAIPTATQQPAVLAQRGISILVYPEAHAISSLVIGILVRIVTPVATASTALPASVNG